MNGGSRSAASVSASVEDASGTSKTLRGIWGYIAPELHGVIERGSPFASDIWALGHIAFQLLTKELAFKYLGSLVNYVTQAGEFPIGLLSKSSALSVEFITSLMCPTPDSRMTAAMAISHTWIGSELSLSGSENDTSPYTQELCAITTTTGTSATWNTKPSDSEANILAYTQDLPTDTLMTENSLSQNTNRFSPAQEIVDHIPNNKIGPHCVDIRLWLAFNILNLTEPMNIRLTFSRNGEWLVVPGGNQAKLWNTLDRTTVGMPIDQAENV
ncbi:hypothetical protein PENFLA_c009G00776 [Penicillium flavigenum]|uniref:Protein kinase domain-containing protein n=1 Tax=Penicillium flavigenum TaxID=254877 RepID=A0A1V6TGU9_9EURO|nr:hypothetical protein PENFLA_c009G00776 [Penicillium flavigenum]